jgi:hypothetical protein
MCLQMMGGSEYIKCSMVLLLDNPNPISTTSASIAYDVEFCSSMAAAAAPTS